ncbi:MAG TPA: hypothetical protein ENK19_09525 [Acidobacteria bacterium]|nr:hypothetical protein [Acidobacteriota bacterium]
MTRRFGKPRAGVLVGTLLLFLLVLSIPQMANAKITLKDKVGDKEIKVKIYGFSQFEMRGGDGQSAEGGLFFHAQRIRVGFNYFHGPIAGKLFLDFNQSHTKDEGGLPKMIKDAFVAYKFSNSAFIRLGMIKTPLGMSFTNPGWNLDIVERNKLDKGLVFERDFGLMLSGRLIGQPEDKKMKCNGLEMGHERHGYGFGYDLGIFNPAGRSAAVTWDKSLLGDALAYVGRLHYDYGRPLHIELSYGVSEQAGGPNTEDYSVWDVGVMTGHPKWEAALEYISGHNIKGVKDMDQDTLSLMGGYMVGRNVEIVVKHYQASADNPVSGSSDLGNTYIGVNWFLSPLRYKARDFQRHKIVLNYIIASGDTDSWTGKWGYLDDGWVLQWQYKF